MFQAAIGLLKKDLGGNRPYQAYNNNSSNSGVTEYGT
jgi:hypothetical protein